MCSRHLTSPHHRDARLLQQPGCIPRWPVQAFFQDQSGGGRVDLKECGPPAIVVSRLCLVMVAMVTCLEKNFWLQSLLWCDCFGCFLLYSCWCPLPQLFSWGAKPSVIFKILLDCIKCVCWEETRFYCAWNFSCFVCFRYYSVLLLSCCVDPN